MCGVPPGVETTDSISAETGRANEYGSALRHWEPDRIATWDAFSLPKRGNAGHNGCVIEYIL